jgi:hypothetical protein
MKKSPRHWMMGWTVPLTTSLGWVAVLGMAFVAPLDEASAQGRGGRGGGMGGGMGGAPGGGQPPMYNLPPI